MTIEERAQKIEEMTKLVMELNHYRDLYYNSNISEITDKEYDELFDKLVSLEKETDFVLLDSPTNTVGYTVKSSFTKVTHSHPMLSLDKTKNPSDVVKFFGGKTVCCMAKMDGLTCSLRYVNGRLISAESRGNGEVGEDLTDNVRMIKSVPQIIPTVGEVIIDGEVIVRTDVFDEINSTLDEESRYRCPRNYAAGSIRNLNPYITAERGLDFVAWKVISGCEEISMYARWKFMNENGFIVVPILPNVELSSDSDVTVAENIIKSQCENKHYPIDGLVFSFDNTLYGKSLGSTSHHVKDQLAFKFYDELYPTKLKFIDWTIGKTGALTPTAVFDEVLIDGTKVTRASLHNISIMENLGITNDCTVNVFKANAIIPQIDSCEFDGTSEIVVPTVCPYCGARTVIKREYMTDVLFCENMNCSGRNLAKFIRFVSRDAMNIVGLSEATLEEMMKRGYIKWFGDIYSLGNYQNELMKIDGFGEKSVKTLLKSIEKSRNVKLENFITALSIDGIGHATAKIISKRFNGSFDEFITALDNRFDFTEINGFGASTNICIYAWYDIMQEEVKELAKLMNFASETISTDSKLSGLRFCITGTFSKPREQLKSELERLGAVFVSSVSSKLDVLFAGENAGSKLDKAKELGVHIADEQELLSYIGETDEQTDTQTEEKNETITQLSLW